MEVANPGYLLALGSAAVLGPMDAVPMGQLGWPGG